MSRLFPCVPSFEMNPDALISSGPHPQCPTQALIENPPAEAQLKISLDAQPSRVTGDTAVADQLLALLKPHAEDHPKWDVWAEEEDESMGEEDRQVMQLRSSEGFVDAKFQDVQCTNYIICIWQDD